LLITGSSANSGSITGALLVFDQTLVATADNLNYGFDAVSNTGAIGSSVVFAASSSGSSGLLHSDCAALQALSNVTANDPVTFSVCPYGTPTHLTAQMHVTFLGVGGSPPYNSTVTATYVWQPGTISGQMATVNPTTSTVYTVTASYLGCSFTQTVLVNVYVTPIPIIQYTNTISVSTVSAMFSVTQSGPTDGSYSLSPACSGLSINATTGLITNSTIACYQTYTVYYCIHAHDIAVGSCPAYCTTAVIALENDACPFAMPQPLTLCPDDKIQLLATGGYGTYTWTPSTGLSCAACNTPTLTFAGTSNTIYTVTAQRSGLTCGTGTLAVSTKTNCQKEEIIGCCFGNYGAAVRINSSNTYLNIYCNLLNELSSGSITVTGNPEKGEFENEQGTVRVLLDWIHNARNTLYISPPLEPPHQGTTSVFGGDQNIKGNSSTAFNELRLEGSGTKSLWINASGYSTLNLNDNILSLQNFMYAMKNPSVNVQRTTGYATNGTNGYFSWLMNNAVLLANQQYLFPLGAKTTSSTPFRYRPLVMANNATSQTDEISADLINAAPSFSNDADFVNASTTASLINNQAPNVLQINKAFYHKIKNTSLSNTVTSNLAIRSYYLPNDAATGDGQFQSLSEWKKDVAQTLSWWATTPGASASIASSTDAVTYGMLYAMANGTLSFNYKPFTLARGGFYVNTNAFGDSGNTNGTTISVTASPLAGSTNTPSGGGLTNAFGTGSNSGNAGTGGNTIFAPNPVSGEYVMNITPPNACATAGQIKFVIDQNGNIAPSTVQYGAAGAPPYLGELSGAVYTIDNQNSGITFSATPASLLKTCVNTVTINTSVGLDFILTQTLSPQESITLYLPAAASGNVITYGAFMLYNMASALVYTSPSNLTSGTTHLFLSATLPAGAYRFELAVTASAIPLITETIKGQLIIK
jgi:hypothetical protein